MFCELKGFNALADVSLFLETYNVKKKLKNVESDGHLKADDRRNQL